MVIIINDTHTMIIMMMMIMTRTKNGNNLAILQATASRFFMIIYLNITYKMTVMILIMMIMMMKTHNCHNLTKSGDILLFN